jgi:hypothetical protein
VAPKQFRISQLLALCNASPVEAHGRRHTQYGFTWYEEMAAGCAIASHLVRTDTLARERWVLTRESIGRWLGLSRLCFRIGLAYYLRFPHETGFSGLFWPECRVFQLTSRYL